MCVRATPTVALPLLAALLQLGLALALRLSDPDLAPFVGWYETAAGRHALVTYGASGGLRLFDFERPSFDVLVAEPAGGFRWQRQQEADQGELAFERASTGAVTGFEWRAAGEQGRARRDDAYGYAQEEVRYRSGEVELCGLLMLPRAASAAPGAVVIQGSGDSDRDNVWAFTFADHLARSGAAVLLTDKPGCGKSGGDWKAVGFEELAQDALAGLALLAARPGVDAARVGLVGLSQGGWIAPLAARRDARVAFVVSVSGATVSVREQVLHELEQTVRAKGGEEAAAIARELVEMAFAFGRTGEGWEDYLAGVEAAPPALEGAFPRARDDWRWAWYARVLDFDPMPLWRELARPGLILYGAEDEHDNVPVAESVARVERLRAQGANDLEVRVIAGSGHALADPARGWVRRDVLDGLARWIAGVRR